MKRCAEAKLIDVDPRRLVLGQAREHRWMIPGVVPELDGLGIIAEGGSAVHDAHPVRVGVIGRPDDELHRLRVERGNKM